jgi:hypothetical protein
MVFFRWLCRLRWLRFSKPGSRSQALEASRSGAFERLRHRRSYSGFVNKPKGLLSQSHQGRHVCSNAHALKNNAPCKGAMCERTISPHGMELFMAGPRTRMPPLTGLGGAQFQIHMQISPIHGVNIKFQRILSLCFGQFVPSSFLC